MMKQSLHIITLLLTFQSIFSQWDPEARKILDRVSERSRADYPIEVSFEYIYDDLREKQTITQNGTLIIEENKFRLTLKDAIVYCDGNTLWNHLVEANEVYISDAEEGSDPDQFFINNPSDLFTFYQKGFKYRLTGELQVNGRTYQEIDIFPEDLEKNYHTVELLIDKEDLRIHSAQAFGKEGVNHTVILNAYKARVPVNEGSFVFNPEDHPDVEVVDTRF
jgi:outer membrane lipoprotein-sorting protein